MNEVAQGGRPDASGIAASVEDRISRPMLWAPPILFAAVLVPALVLQPRVAFDSPWVLTALNLVFLTALPLVASVLAVAAYRRSGAAMLLALGTGMLATALGSGVLPALLEFPGGANATVTIHNLAVLLAALCHFGAAIGGMYGLMLHRHRGRIAAAAYAAVVLGVAVVVALYLQGRIPVFWTASGTTDLRLGVLGTAVGLLAMTALYWGQVLLRDRRLCFLRWYVPGLALWCLGLIAIGGQDVYGGLVSWLGRSGQYLASVYLLVAVARETLPWRTGEGAGELGFRILQSALPFRPLVESTSDAVVALDRRRRVLYWNDAAGRLFGIEGDEGFGADPVNLLLPTSATDEDRLRLHDLLELPDGVRAPGRTQLVLGGPAGRTFPAELMVLRSPDDNRLLICVITDISDRVLVQEELERRVRRRTEQLQQLNADLERANASKDEFLGLVSHELKTPITSILAASAILERRLGAADPEGILRDLEAEASRLAGIVDNLLALARMDSGRGGEREPIPLDRVVANTVTALRREHPCRTLEVHAAAGLVVDGNDVQLAMVVRNYVANAVRYSPDEAPIEIEVAAAGSSARVEVRDRGVGVPEGETEAVFEPFHRSSATSEVAGIGIGLTVCRRIVEAHGGSLGAARRRDGGGSIFWFEIPLADDDLLDDAGPNGLESEPAAGEEATRSEAIPVA